MEILAYDYENGFIRKAFSSIDDCVCSEIKLSGISSHKMNYIYELVGTIEAIFGHGTIKAVFLFGSYSYDNPTSVSDIDLLIIVSNSIAPLQIRKIEPVLEAIELKHNFKGVSKRWDAKIVSRINRSTGMFSSHFICRQQAWDSNNFANIFGTSKFFTKWLAPSRIVLDSVKSGVTPLFGRNFIYNSSMPSQYSKREIIKSLIMCLLLTMGATCILPFDKSYMKYVLEAFKWGLRSCTFYLFRQSQPLNQILGNYSEYQNVQNYQNTKMKYLPRFQELRRNLELDLKFALRTPWELLKLHKAALKFPTLQRKMLQDKKQKTHSDSFS